MANTGGSASGHGDMAGADDLQNAARGKQFNQTVNALLGTGHLND
jgi:hypothetical protein